MNSDNSAEVEDHEIPGLLLNSKMVHFADAIDTVKKSRARFSRRDQLRADRVRRLQHVAGFPSDETLTHSVVTNGIENNPISKRDVQICQEMLGRSKCISQGKTTMKRSDAIDVNKQTVELPNTILTYYGNVQLAADVLHVNDVPFLTSISNHFHHGTCKAVDNMQASSLEEGLKNVIRSYAIRGFSIGIIFLDVQF